MESQFLTRTNTWTANLNSMLNAIQDGRSSNKTIAAFKELALNNDWVNFGNRIIPVKTGFRSIFEAEIAANKTSWTYKLNGMIKAFRKNQHSEKVVSQFKKLAFNSDWVDHVNETISEAKILKKHIKNYIESKNEEIKILDIIEDKNDLDKFNELTIKIKAAFGEIGDLKEFIRLLKKTIQYSKTTEIRMENLHISKNEVFKTYNFDKKHPASFYFPLC